MRFSCALRIAPEIEQSDSWSKIRKDCLWINSHQPGAEHTSGRILGLDVGDRRVGVAVSDETGAYRATGAHPGAQEPAAGPRLPGRLVRKYGCTQVVVGNPLYMSGDVSPQALKAQAFAQDLQHETGVERHRFGTNGSRPPKPIVTWTQPATPGKRRGVIDQVAAVLILQSFLDSRR